MEIFDAYSITEGLARKNKLVIGDKLYSLIDNEIKEYTIVNILVSPYDFSRYQVNEKKEYIFVGFDENQLNQNAIFLSFSSFNHVDDSINVGAKDYFYVSTTIRQVRLEIILRYLMIFIVGSISVVCYLLIDNFDMDYLTMLHNQGKKNKKIILRCFIKCLIYLIVFFALIYLLSFKFHINLFVAFIESAFVNTIILLVTILRFTRRLI